MAKNKLQEILEEQFGITDISVLPEKTQRKYQKYVKWLSEKRIVYFEKPDESGKRKLKPQFLQEMIDLQEDIIEDAAIYKNQTPPPQEPIDDPEPEPEPDKKSFWDEFFS